MKTFGDRIKELRDKKDLSLRELAKQLKLTAPFLSDIETGKRFPSDDTMMLLANALDTTVEDLSQYDSRPPIAEMKRMANQNPALGIAFRKIAELPPDEILSLLEKHSKEKNPK